MRLYEMSFSVVRFCCGSCGHRSMSLPVMLTVIRHSDEDECSVGIRCLQCKSTIFTMKLFPQVEVTWVEKRETTVLNLNYFQLRELV